MNIFVKKSTANEETAKIQAVIYLLYIAFVFMKSDFYLEIFGNYKLNRIKIFLFGFQKSYAKFMQKKLQTS